MSEACRFIGVVGAIVALSQMLFGFSIDKPRQRLRIKLFHALPVYSISFIDIEEIAEGHIFELWANHIGLELFFRAWMFGDGLALFGKKQVAIRKREGRVRWLVLSPWAAKRFASELSAAIATIGEAHVKRQEINT